MDWLRQTWSRLRDLFGRGRLEREMAEELRLHLEMRTERHIAAGLSPAEARLAAQRSSGGVAQSQPRVRDERTFVWIEQAAPAIRYALPLCRPAAGLQAVGA